MTTTISDSKTQAFAGIRILDFTQVLAGPCAVMQLALLGAEVIKVEQPGSGDQMRSLMTTSTDGLSPGFQTANLNKRSITLDLKSASAERVIAALVPRVDVVVENFKAGTMDRLGFGYGQLIEMNEGLIYCAISGYGQTGPGAGAAAYDGAIQAASGMMWQTGQAETGPTRTGYMPCDMGTALHAAFAISSALLRRERTGRGQLLDVAMQDTAIVMQAAQFSNYMNEGTLPGLLGNLSSTRAPTADTFPTADGYLQISALRDNQVHTLMDVIGIGDRFAEPAFTSEQARIANANVVQAAVRAALSEAGTAHWLEVIGRAGVPVAEVRDIPDVIRDPQLEGRGVLQEVARADDPERSSRVVTAGFVANEDGPAIRQPAPLLGADTHSILTEAGFSGDEVKAMQAEGAL